MTTKSTESKAAGGQKGPRGGSKTPKKNAAPVPTPVETAPSDPTPDERPAPGEGRPDIPREVLHDVKKRLDVLMQKRETASNSLQRAIQTAEQAKTQSLVLRGRISVYEEQIAEIEKKYGVKVPPVQ